MSNRNPYRAVRNASAEFWLEQAELAEDGFSTFWNDGFTETEERRRFHLKASERFDDDLEYA